jgi:hypothetical protein
MLQVIPEFLHVANVYLESHSIDETATRLKISPLRVQEILNDKQTKEYLNQIYLESGFRNKFTLANTVDELIKQKLQEAQETGFYTKADLMDLLEFSHKLRMDEEKRTQQTAKTTNVQINEFGQGNYGELMKKLIGVK